MIDCSIMHRDTFGNTVEIEPGAKFQSINRSSSLECNNSCTIRKCQSEPLVRNGATIYLKSIPGAVSLITQFKGREDRVYHPETGEKLSKKSIETVEAIRLAWKNGIPDVQVISSNGLNPRKLTDDAHLFPFLENLTRSLKTKGFQVSLCTIAYTHSRVGSLGKFCLENQHT